MQTLNERTKLSNPKAINSLEKNSRDNYLYNREGPWPQPSPRDPKGEAPAVLRLPRQEKESWKKEIGKRYMKNMWTYWPKALKYSIKHKGLSKIDDLEFNDLLTKGVFSKFLSKGITPQKKKIFEAVFPFDYNKGDYYVIDLSLMSFTKPFEGIFASGTIILFEKIDNNLKAQFIYVDEYENDKIVNPSSESDLWEMAKVFAMQGAAYKLILSEHALLHFPFDCINAISKSSLPINSILLQLLLPHFEHTLVLNKVVLNSTASPVENNQKFPYSGFLGDGDGQRSLVACAYSGIDGNDNYNGYNYSKEIEKFDSPYYTFLLEYYKVIKNFVSNVVQIIDEEEMQLIAEWAKYINQWIPTFSNGEKIMNKETLIEEASMIIWDVSVAHSADHYSFAQIPSYLIPLRVRIDPKSVGNKLVNWKKGMKINDMFRYRMEREMFFKPTNVSTLHDTKYRFDKVRYSKETRTYLEELNTIFLNDLVQLENKLKSKEIPSYIPLKEIARSIQY
ncbi:hypothetical protein KMW28_11765 [Flammeovirga yaeyamensis]|uniref:Lipoxygenase domain-containing protein n=1 Tax=Flammeovirga yaeyamensis TaxID=367791 RepID=A0AAX1MYE4_9BACT|nr:hypothetical protein [Flammeovirga yaeyamensis]MBB3696161.1 hypothetical protein [Flammeovirga yaeyamensis]NMF34844.1 hypothetical protein [Flammeovirga yaeyamensis]QWG00328.1 hypothetical protein KMW28_11765 [Flammeovirga yaeyamensis]